MPDPWRRRCPEGHTSIVTRPSKSTYRCHSCEQVYRGEPVDVKDDADTKPESREFESIHPLTAVTELWRVTGGEGAVKAKRLSKRSVAYGQALRRADEQGFVEVVNPETNGANRWRLTTAGERIASSRSSEVTA